MRFRWVAACPLVGFLTAGVLGGAPPALGDADVTTLEAYWPFNEDGGDVAEDVTGHGHEGVITGGSEWVDGKFGSALAFNGSDGFVDVPDMYGMEAFDSGTIEFWANIELWDDFDNLFGTQSAANNINTIRFERTWPDDDPVTVYQGGPGGNYGTLASAGKVAEGTWAHVAYAWGKDDNEATVFLDGVPNVGPVSNWPDAYAAMRIGTGYAGRWTQGTLDEVRIWRSALTEEDIRSNMTKGYAAILAVSPSGKLATTWALVKSQR